MQVEDIWKRNAGDAKEDHSSESKMVHQLRDQEYEARGSSPIEVRFFEK